MKAFVIGRHAPDLGSTQAEIVAQENVTFPAQSEDCTEILEDLMHRAMELGAKLLLQNTPGQVAVALAHMYASANGGTLWAASRSLAFLLTSGQLVGVIVSAPVFAEDGTPRGFAFSHIEWL